MEPGLASNGGGFERNLAQSFVVDVWLFLLSVMYDRLLGNKGIHGGCGVFFGPSVVKFAMTIVETRRLAYRRGQGSPEGLRSSGNIQSQRGMRMGYGICNAYLSVYSSSFWFLGDLHTRGGRKGVLGYHKFRNLDQPVAVWLPGNLEEQRGNNWELGDWNPGATGNFAFTSTI